MSTLQDHFVQYLNKYAELAIKTGVNLQGGQTLVILAPISTADFVRVAVQKAFAAGAGNVHVEWTDEEITKITYQIAPLEALQQFPIWKANGMEEYVKNGAAILSISASNPDLLKGIDPERISLANKARAEALKSFNEYIRGSKVSWTIVSVPTPEWAKKIFPGKTEEQAVELLWETIFKVTRVDQADPVQAWQEHIHNLEEKVDFLNRKKFKQLHYVAPGTDLTIELPAQHLWVGGDSKDDKGTTYVPNMPTEEVFTTPLREGANGVVKSTKPLNYSGNLIENFSLTFENGRITDFTAETGYDVLKKLIETDEGSHYLGEIALVPHHSPVSNSNLIFYNTLFDENASCHLAIGASYPFTLVDGTKMNKQQLEDAGINFSLMHVDFMIGSAELQIDGITADGTRDPLFRNGNWAI